MGIHSVNDIVVNEVRSNLLGDKFLGTDQSSKIFFAHDRE